jgi:hypothetical protein
MARRRRVAAAGGRQRDHGEARAASAEGAAAQALERLRARPGLQRGFGLVIPRYVKID